MALSKRSSQALLDSPTDRAVFILLDNGKEENGQSTLVPRFQPKQSATASGDKPATTTERSASELGKLRDRAHERGHGLQGRGGRSSGEESLGSADELQYNLSLNFEKCDWADAINFQPRHHGTFGYLLSWSGCDGIDLQQDITVVNPFTTAGQTMSVTADADGVSGFKCVGVIEKFMYPGEEDDPIFISAYLSKQNAASLHGAFQRVQPKTDVEVAWYIIQCEGAGEGWYEAAFIDGFGKASANIDSAPVKRTAQSSRDVGGYLRINIAHESTSLSDDVDIRLYKFGFQIIPAPGETTLLHFSTSSGAKKVLKWKGKSQA